MQPYLWKKNEFIVRYKNNYIMKVMLLHFGHLNHIFRTIKRKYNYFQEVELYESSS